MFNGLSDGHSRPHSAVAFFIPYEALKQSLPQYSTWMAASPGSTHLVASLGAEIVSLVNASSLLTIPPEN